MTGCGRSRLNVFPLSMTSAKELLLALRLARRELRGGLSGFLVFLACLALGVAAVSGVQSTSAAFTAGIRADAAKLLGGDVETTLTHRQASDAQLAFLKTGGRLSRVATMRAMASSAPKKQGERPRRTLAALKAVDDAYPLYGSMALEPPTPLRAALEEKDGRFGAVADPVILKRLGLALGDDIRLADGVFQVRAVIKREPDASVSLAAFGPRVMIAGDGLAQTGLLRPGSLVRHRCRVKLDPPHTPAAFANAVKEAFPDAGWRVRDVSGTAPGLSLFLDRMTAVLSLVGLSALLLGGLGVSEAVSGYLEGKTASIASMKCLGAPGRLLFLTFFLQVLFLTAVGVAAGLVLGASAPYALGPFLARLLPVRLVPGIYPEALALAAAFGLLTALLFSLTPLSRARRVSALVLFRGPAAARKNGPGPTARAAAGLCALALAALAVSTTGDKRLGLGFVAAAAMSWIVFRSAAFLLVRLFKAAPRPKNARLRLALSGLHRPGNSVKSVLASLGLGLTVLAGMALVDANFKDRMQREIPEQAPSFFFIDIQPHQLDAFKKTVAAVPGVRSLEAAPTVRGRFLELNGVPVEDIDVSPDAAWVLRGDRALTVAAAPPKGADVVRGAWWPEDRRGPPLVSMDEKIAEGFGAKLGDTVTFNVLGRRIDAKIASLRRINWLSLSMNYVFVLSPGALDNTPLTWIAAAYTDKSGDASSSEADEAVFEAVTAKFPNITVVSIGETLEDATALAEKIGAAVTAAAAATLAAGMLVLAQSLRAALRRRFYETVIYKVCGATRGDIIAVLLLEYALLGVVAGITALFLGAVLSWFFVTTYFQTSWSFFPGPALMTVAGAAVLTLALGLGGVRRLLGRKAWPYLRNE